jgi:hypothetical protein
MAANIYYFFNVGKKTEKNFLLKNLKRSLFYPRRRQGAVNNLIK